MSSFILGSLFLSRGTISDYEKALTIFTLAIDHTEQEVDDEDYFKAEVEYSLAVFYQLRGRSYAALEKNSDALKDYEMSTKYAPDLLETYVALGNLFYVQGDYSKAKTHYEVVQNTAIGKLGLSLIEYNTANYSAAKLLLNEALLLIDNDGALYRDASKMQILYALGMTNKQLDNWSESVRFFQAVCDSSVAVSFVGDACLELTEVAHNELENGVTHTKLITFTQTPTLATDLATPSREMGKSSSPRNSVESTLPAESLIVTQSSIPTVVTLTRSKELERSDSDSGSTVDPLLTKTPTPALPPTVSRLPAPYLPTATITRSSSADNTSSSIASPLPTRTPTPALIRTVSPLPAPFLPTATNTRAIGK